MINYISRSWKSLFIILLLSSGCSKHPFIPQADSPAFFVHTLETGETLGQLSTWYTGSENHWREFYIKASDADRHKLRVGGLILIPKQLLIRADKPSQNFLKKAHKKPSAQIKPSIDSILLPNVQIEEAIEQPEQNTVEDTRKESLEDEFLDQIIDSTKLQSKDNETLGPDSAASGELPSAETLPQ